VTDLLKRILEWDYPYKPFEGKELSWKDSAILEQQKFIKELLTLFGQEDYDKIKEKLGELYEEVSGREQ